MTTKRDLIYAIEQEDNKQGQFHENGQYRYGVKFYYGKLEKYNKNKLAKILAGLKR